MDSELLREREAFKKRAMAMPVVENKRAALSSDGAGDSHKKKTSALGALSQSAKAKLEMNKMKSMMASSGGGGGSSKYRFGVLAKIVRHMKNRHMEGMDHPLNLEEILDETNQLDASTKVRQWLANESLKDNPKLRAFPDGTYLFKPPYDITNKKGLVKLLRQHDLRGLGGIFLEDIQESLAKSEKFIRQLTEENKIIIINRSIDKKKVIFHHDHNSDFHVDDEFQKLWRSVAVDSLDDAKIDEYLEKQGIRSMQDLGAKRVATKHLRKKAARRKNRGPKDNDHLKHVLEDYNEMSVTKRDK
ncbi:transcription initiation factor IIE subunit beta-like [Tigriopus californicus]|uniref:transcription initiation factor IIE subunit beta-like n=1 Tax=Tigriopus californicus TaxID=6832 RepID=UPI0027DA6272|nr:transcription initiation factor IIE subunit beta-like [Tigriopus californicus]|eukprot:TCALIF_08320-PA protein Name:"Similar to GTF2E2 Transcription initiation factor IIE subunit beta (Homo sapiens)" AED:0.00 eAED:0.00 QI:0/-1/0/1/-1/1/1/0/301